MTAAPDFKLTNRDNTLLGLPGETLRNDKARRKKLDERAAAKAERILAASERRLASEAETTEERRARGKAERLKAVAERKKSKVGS